MSISDTEYMRKPSARHPGGSPLPPGSPPPTGERGLAPGRRRPAPRPGSRAVGAGRAARGIVPLMEFAYAGQVLRLTSVRGWLAVTAVAVAAGCGAPKAPAIAEPSVSPFTDAPSGAFAVTGATVVTMAGGVLADHTVVVKGGRIAALGPTGQVEVPAGATVIDGAGKWVMPGLADMHVHLWNKDDLTLFLAAGVTTVRNMSGEPRHLGWR